MTAFRNISAEKAGRISLPRSLLLAFMMISFLSQTYITQTHIHGAVHSSAQGIVRILSDLSGDEDAFTPGGGTGQKHNPVKSDPAHCVFCQAVGYAGAFVSPAAALLVLVPQNLSVIPSQISIAARVEAVPHFWHGRAPPRA
jgi:hypothetical protein